MVHALSKPIWRTRQQYRSLEVPPEARDAFEFPARGSTALYRQPDGDTIHVIAYLGTGRASQAAVIGQKVALHQWNGNSGREVLKITGAGAQTWIEEDEGVLRGL